MATIEPFQIDTSEIMAFGEVLNDLVETALNDGVSIPKAPEGSFYELVEFVDDTGLSAEGAGVRTIISGGHAALQLCAQALCLEEMFGKPVPAGALYSHATKRRTHVDIDGDLRQRTLKAVAAVRELLNQQRLPPPVNDSRCPNCSLINACLPAVVAEAPRVRGYQGALFRPGSDGAVEGWFDV